MDIRIPAAGTALMAGLLAIGLGACGDGDGGGRVIVDPRVSCDDALPEAWAGEWDMTVVFTSCDDPEDEFEFSDTTIFCAGESFVESLMEAADEVLECSFERSGSSFTYAYKTRSTEGPCVTTVTASGSGSFDGGTYAGTGTTTTTIGGDGCSFPGTICSNSVVSGTKISQSQAGCGSASSFGFAALLAAATPGR